MKFYFDEHLPPVIVDAMNIIAATQDDEIKHLRREHGPGVADVDWLQAFGTAREWVVVSCDGFNKSKEEKREIVSRTKCAFILAKGFGNMEFWEFAGRLLLKWPSIRATALTSPEGAVWKVAHSSSEIVNITSKYL